MEGLGNINITQYLISRKPDNLDLAAHDVSDSLLSAGLPVGVARWPQVVEYCATPHTEWRSNYENPISIVLRELGKSSRRLFQRVNTGMDCLWIHPGSFGRPKLVGHTMRGGFPAIFAGNLVMVSTQEQIVQLNKLLLAEGLTQDAEEFDRAAAQRAIQRAEEWLGMLPSFATFNFSEGMFEYFESEPAHPSIRIPRSSRASDVLNVLEGIEIHHSYYNCVSPRLEGIPHPWEIAWRHGVDAAGQYMRFARYCRLDHVPQVRRSMSEFLSLPYVPRPLHEQGAAIDEAMRDLDTGSVLHDVDVPYVAVRMDADRYAIWTWEIRSGYGQFHTVCLL